MIIRDVPLETVWIIRQQVMYPDESIDFVQLEDDEAGKHLGLFVRDELVSIISVFDRHEDWQIRKFATRNAWQGRGYGKLLLQHVFDEARKAGTRSIYCNARQSATRIYEQFGMKRVGQSWEQYGHAFTRMEIQLDRSGASVNKMEIIPAIDIIDGKCVRLTQGDYDQKKVYNEQPVEVARRFEDAGLRRLHLVDLDGARKRSVQNWKVLEQIASATGMIIDFGGGINTDQDLRIVFSSGARYAAVGSIAVKEEDKFLGWLDQFGAQRFLLGADVKEGKIAIHGWTETTALDLFEFIQHYHAEGITQLFCTDIGKDGKLEGPATELYREIIKAYPALYLIASGGVATIDDLYQLQEAGCKAAIVGKAIYENRISLGQLKSFL